MKRGTLIAGGVVLAVVVVAGAGFAYSAANSRTTVGTATAAVAPLAVTVSASGTVDAANKRDVFPPVAGTLATVSVKDGQQVAKGDKLATLDAAPLKLAVAQAQSSLTAAKAALTAALAQRVLVNDKFSVAQEKRAAQEAVDSAREAVSVAKATLAQAKANLAHAKLVAPIAGVVTVPDTTQPGLGVTPSVPIATVAAPGKLVFVAAVDEGDVARVKPGNTAKVTLDAFPATPFTGKVNDIRTSPQTTGTGGIAFPARIGFEAGDSRVFLGMNGSADVEVEAIPDALTVPIQAVITEGAGRFVYLVGPDGVVHKTPVKIGAETDTLAQVLDGLSAGAQVVTTGATTLTDGQSVQVAS